MYTKDIKEKKELNPFWVSGFLQGEGCFTISFTKRLSSKPKVEVRPSFSVVQPIKTKQVLFHLQKFFDCGFIRISRKDSCYRYEVRSLKDLVDKILPHLDQFPMLFEKEANYQIFKKICLSMHRNKHKNTKALEIIIEEAYSMNLPGSRKYSKEELLKLMMS